MAINLIAAAGRHDYASLYALAPKTVGDGCYLVTALAELAADLINASGRDLHEVIDELRGQTIKHQLTGGRPM